MQQEATTAETDMVASVMIWNATTSVLIPKPIIAIETSTSHSMCLNKPPQTTARIAAAEHGSLSRIRQVAASV